MTRLLKIVFIFLCILLSSQKIESKEIQFLDPVIVDQSFSDLSEKQYSPNLTLDSKGYFLTYHINGINGSNIKTITLQTEPQFLTQSEYTIIDSTFNPHQPTSKQFQNNKILFFYDILSNEHSNDTLFNQKLLMYNDNTPHEDDIDNIFEFYSLNNSISYKSQFASTDDRIYCEVVKRELTDKKNNRWELSLRSINESTAELYPPNLHFSANGKTAMIPYGDSLLVIKSWIYCVESENLTCTKWGTGYKAYVVYQNKIQFIYALKTNEITDQQLLPDDIFVKKINGSYLFALRQSKQLMKIDFATMDFEEILNLSLYTQGTYKKIIPLQTIDYCVILLIDEDNNGTIMRFDNKFEFIDSVSIPFEGEVTEISDFVYDASKDMLSYAYTTKLFDNNQSSRIFLQSVLFDKELIYNPPPALPERFSLSQNYPNPFNPTTTIAYNTPSNGHVTIDIYNILGQKVSTLYDAPQNAGEHLLKWDASNQSTGIYLVKVSYENQTKSIKTMLLK